MLFFDLPCVEICQVFPLSLISDLRNDTSLAVVGYFYNAIIFYTFESSILKSFEFGTLHYIHLVLGCIKSAFIKD